MLIWTLLTPSLATMETFSFHWAGLILLRNIGLAIAVYGAWHMWLYVWRKQVCHSNTIGNGPRRILWPSCSKTRHMIICSHAVSGVPIWTAYEVLLLWAYANNIAPLINFAQSPVWFIVVFFLVPFIHEVGFYCSSLSALAAII